MKTVRSHWKDGAIVLEVDEVLFRYNSKENQSVVNPSGHLTAKITLDKLKSKQDSSRTVHGGTVLVEKD